MMKKRLTTSLDNALGLGILIKFDLVFRSDFSHHRGSNPNVSLSSAGGSSPFPVACLTTGRRFKRKDERKIF